jgi:uncharacterized protein (DUF4415 family)
MKDTDMKTNRSAEDQAMLERLAAMPDEEIDTDDIPEAPAENWAFAIRPGLYRPVKRHVTMRLDADVIEWFKARAGGRGYQSEINRALRKVAGLG